MIAIEQSNQLEFDLASAKLLPTTSLRLANFNASTSSG
jgi:hypothetical protein